MSTIQTFLQEFPKESSSSGRSVLTTAQRCYQMQQSETDTYSELPGFTMYSRLDILRVVLNFSLSTLLSIIAMSAASAQEGKSVSPSLDPIDIELKDVRWQVLPVEVSMVRVSPDDRPWYLLNSSDTLPQLRLADIKKVVEREFSKPSPQLRGVGMVFFEAAERTGPGSKKLKRVWIVCEKNRTLLGYDGTKWNGPRISGIEDKSTWQKRYRFFIQLEDEVVFLNAGWGAHVLRGEGWTYENFRSAGGRKLDDVMKFMGSTWVDADGRTLTVLHSGQYSTGRGKKRMLVLRRYRDGKWTEIPLPEGFHNCYNVHGAMLDETIYLTSTQTRKRKLEAISIDSDNRLKTLDTSKPFALGPYRIKLTGDIGNDRRGSFYAYCQEAQKGRERIGPSLIVHDFSGNTRHVSYDESPFFGHFGWHTDMALYTDDGKRAWIGAPHTVGRCLLMDMETLEIVDRSPSTLNMFVLSTMNDGTTFLKRLSKIPWESPRFMVYRPSMPESGRVITGRRLGGEQDIRGMCVASDGAIWVSCRENGVRRYDGQRWESPLSTVKAKLTAISLIPGQDGSVLTLGTHPAKGMRIINGVPQHPIFEPTYFVMNPRGITTAGTVLGEAVAARRKEVAKAFAGPRTCRPWFGFGSKVWRTEGGVLTDRYVDVSCMGIVTDKRGNIWTNSFGKVSVFVGSKVTEVSIPPNPSKPSMYPARVLDMAIIGDGEDVFLRLSDSRSFFARVTLEGEIGLLSGPKVETPRPMHRFEPFLFQDHAGGVWVTLASDGPRSSRDRNQPRGPVVRRITSVKKWQDFPGMGVVETVDAAGCVWLAPTKGRDEDLFTVWAPDGETSTVRVPGRIARNTIFPGRKGQVFVWTEMGLHELLAKDPKNPSKHEIEQIYILQRENGKPMFGFERINRPQYSSLGYVVLAALPEPNPKLTRFRSLFIFQLDGEKAVDISDSPAE